MKVKIKLVKLCFLASLTGSVSVVQAADTYTPSAARNLSDIPAVFTPISWSGFYVGVNGGYGFSSGTKSLSFNDGGAGTFVGGDSSARAQPSGAFSGGQIGYNFQSGSIVYGLETDLQGTAIWDRTSGTTAVNDLTYQIREGLDYFGTLRGRLGYSFGRTLLYTTGGLAYGELNRKDKITDGGPNLIVLKSSGMATGYVAGIGAEYKLSSSLSLKAEYQYLDFGSDKLSGIDTLTEAPVRTNSIDNNLSTVRIGLNFRFGGASDSLR